MKKKKDKLVTVFLLLVLGSGLTLLLYPMVSDQWNSYHQTKAIAQYKEAVDGLGEEEYEKMWEEAEFYNAALSAQGNKAASGKEQKEEYEKMLNVGKLGVMCYIEIPGIKCTLPVYHGTEESVLQIAAGHVEWSSLPVGGESSHCVISGHRGLPSARLFSDLDQMEEGDFFRLHVLNEVLTYEVDQILIVEPQETAALQIVEGKDYCTLVTCTPYGINTHRLLVRGHRISGNEEITNIHVTADAVLIRPYLVIITVAIPVMLLILIFLLLPQHAKNGGEGNEK